MLFAIGPGSDGGGIERYSLYLPFSLAPEHQLQDSQEFVAFSLQGYSAEIQKLRHFYFIKVHPFPTPEEARNYLDTLQACLLRLSLTNRIGISYPKKISEIYIFDEPVEISEKSNLYESARLVGWTVAHGHYDADKVAVIPEHRSIWRFESGRPALLLGHKIERFAELIAASAPPRAVSLDSEFPRLKLAIELYNSCAFDLPPNAQLITLVSALESITPDTAISPEAADCLDEAVSTLKTARNQEQRGTEAYRELDNLVNRAGLLKRQSIGSELRALVLPIVEQTTALQEFGDVASKLRNAYQMRSTLLHNGTADSSQTEESLAFLKEFVRALLIELLDRNSIATTQET